MVLNIVLMMLFMHTSKALEKSQTNATDADGSLAKALAAFT